MTKNLFYLLFLSLIVAGCDNVEFKKTKGGMPYKVWSENKSGKKVEVGKFVKMHYMQKVNDSLLFTTYNSMPMYFPVEASKGSYDITEVIPTLKEGDSVMAVQLIDTFMKRDPRMAMGSPFKKGDKFITTITILKVFDRADDYVQDEEKEAKKITDNEPEVVQQYMKKNNIQGVKTPGGTFVQVLTQGSGPRVDTGKYVRVMYTGRKFDGTVFDSNIDPAFQHPEPLGFTVGRQEMLPGFDEAVRMLNVGSKAKIVIPSSQAYGRNGRAPKIMPFESLVFDIEVLDVSDKAPAKPQMPQTPPHTDQH